MREFGDQTEPRYYCDFCGIVEYCRDHLRAEFPPKATLRAIQKRNKGCVGRIRYAAGLLPYRRIGAS